ncbi:MAG: 6-bladed beta-propeller [Candidatus Aminicenantes bacterium]|jgi:hypothetical protein
MKQIILIFFLTAVTLIGAEELTVVRNPAKPSKAHAGRIIAIKEVMRITDAEGDFYFKNPEKIKIAPDESIFIVDRYQFLRFDKNGKFMGNQQKKGKGPGEYVIIRNYFFSKNAIIIYAYLPDKIIETDLTGNLLKEKRLKIRHGFYNVLAYDKGKFWVFDAGPRDWSKAKAGRFNVNKELCLEASDETIHKTGLQFPEKAYRVRRELNGAKQSLEYIITPTLVALDGENSLYVSHSRQYNINRVDLIKEIIAGAFNRKYTGVAYQKKKEEDGDRILNPPDPEFFNDIQKLYFHNDRLWVLTSTIEKEKGVLVDIFSREGKYMDNFYLPLPQVETVHQLEEISLTFHKNHFFIVEKDEEENPVVVKYQYQLL